jgi:hypothetical protein
MIELTRAYESQPRTLREFESLAGGLALVVVPSFLPFCAEWHWSTQLLVRAVGGVLLVHGLTSMGLTPTDDYPLNFLTLTSTFAPTTHQGSPPLSRKREPHCVQMVSIPHAPYPDLQPPAIPEEPEKQTENVLTVLRSLQGLNFDPWRASIGDPEENDAVGEGYGFDCWLEEKVCCTNPNLDFQESANRTQLELGLRLALADACDLDPRWFDLFIGHFQLTLDRLLPYAQSDGGFQLLVDRLTPLLPSLRLADRINGIRANLGEQRRPLAWALDALLQCISCEENAHWINTRGCHTVCQGPFGAGDQFAGEQEIAQWVRRHALTLDLKTRQAVMALPDAELASWARMKFELATMPLDDSFSVAAQTIPPPLKAISHHRFKEWMGNFDWQTSDTDQLIEMGIGLAALQRCGMDPAELDNFLDGWRSKLPVTLTAVARRALALGSSKEEILDHIRWIVISLNRFSLLSPNHQEQFQQVIDAESLDRLATFGRLYEKIRDRRFAAEDSPRELETDATMQQWLAVIALVDHLQPSADPLHQKLLATILEQDSSAESMGEAYRQVVAELKERGVSDAVVGAFETPPETKT